MKCRSVNQNFESESNNSNANFLSNGLSDDCGIDENDAEISKYNNTDVLNGAVTHASSGIQNGDSEGLEGIDGEISKAVGNM